jgi:hypothetical protein
MPFGKHKGVDIKLVPIDYLQWLLKSDIQWIHDDVRAEIKRRGFGDRKASSSFGSSSSSPGPSSSKPLKIATDIYRKLALKWHPDRNKGSSDPMKAINDFMDLLKKEL